MPGTPSKIGESLSAARAGLGPLVCVPTKNASATMCRTRMRVQASTQRTAGAFIAAAAAAAAGGIGGGVGPAAWVRSAPTTSTRRESATGRLGKNARGVSDQRCRCARLAAPTGRPFPSACVAVDAEISDRPAGRAIGSGATVRARDEVRGAPQVIRGEVRAQVGAVAEDDPVLHQAVVEEQLLALVDVRAAV